MRALKVEYVHSFRKYDMSKWMRVVSSHNSCNMRLWNQSSRTVPQDMTLRICDRLVLVSRIWHSFFRVHTTIFRRYLSNSLPVFAHALTVAPDFLIHRTTTQNSLA